MSERKFIYKNCQFKIIKKYFQLNETEGKIILNEGANYK